MIFYYVQIKSKCKEGAGRRRGRTFSSGESPSPAEQKREPCKGNYHGMHQNFSFDRIDHQKITQCSTGTRTWGSGERRNKAKASATVCSPRQNQHSKVKQSRANLERRESRRILADRYFTDHSNGSSISAVEKVAELNCKGNWQRQPAKEDGIENRQR